MKITILTSLLLMALRPLTASAEDLACQVKMNAEKVAAVQLEVPAQATGTIAEIDDYRIKISNLGASKFEIEVYDSAVPSRSYANGFLRSPADEVTWTLWTRDILLEASCQLRSAPQRG